MNYLKRYQSWLDDPYIDDDIKEELKSIKDDGKAIENRFFKDLEFGTAGFRGLMQAGTNGLNKYTVARITSGLAHYINNNFKKGRVVIAYDSRHNSKEFAEICATILNNNNIETYLFKQLKPVPVLSFAVTHLKVDFGIMVTSSHNPREYNGYKIYGKDGGQVVDNIEMDIAKEINMIDNFKEIKGLNLKIKNPDIYHIINEEIDTPFINETIKCILNKKHVKDFGAQLNIVYTPLHGTGFKPMDQILTKTGFKPHYVLEQKDPDPDFTTVPYPNPELIETFTLAKQLAHKVNADIVLASDPDADRLGVMVKDNNKYTLLNGNEISAILISYILDNINIKPNSFIIKSIVSGNLANKIAKSKKVETIEVLTGFKYISDQINSSTDKNFIFGFEESLGYMVNPYVKDKNSLSAALLICEIACYLKKNNKTLIDYLEEINTKYNYYVDETLSITYEGLNGIKTIDCIMELFRKTSFEAISGIKVVKKTDYQYDNTNLPKANVIKIFLEDDSWIAVRPSATEPKIKLYFQTNDQIEEVAKDKLEQIKSAILAMLENV